jgi:hypothetical protein
MTSRRSFLIQGTLASTAVLAFKPLATIARATSYFTGVSGSYGKLAFVHTAHLNVHNKNKVIQYMHEIKNSHTNAILLKSGQDIEEEPGLIADAVSIDNGDAFSTINGDYKIVNKAGIKTGIIRAKEGDRNLIQKINSLSAYLKKEKN